MILMTESLSFIELSPCSKLMSLVIVNTQKMTIQIVCITKLFLTTLCFNKNMTQSSPLYDLVSFSARLLKVYLLTRIHALQISRRSANTDISCI